MNQMVRDEIAAAARAHEGSQQWLDDDVQHINKCNLFVHDMITQAAGAFAPPMEEDLRSRIRYYLGRTDSPLYPALAGDWANPNKTLSCWQTVPGGADKAQPGDVIAEAIQYSGSATGHVGIVTGNQETTSTDSTAYCQGLPPGTITVNDYGFRPDDYVSPDGCRNPLTGQDARLHGRKRYAVVKRFVCR